MTYDANDTGGFIMAIIAIDGIQLYCEQQGSV